MQANQWTESSALMGVLLSALIAAGQSVPPPPMAPGPLPEPPPLLPDPAPQPAADEPAPAPEVPAPKEPAPAPKGPAPAPKGPAPKEPAPAPEGPGADQPPPPNPKSPGTPAAPTLPFSEPKPLEPGLEQPREPKPLKQPVDPTPKPGEPAVPEAGANPPAASPAPAESLLPAGDEPPLPSAKLLTPPRRGASATLSDQQGDAAREDNLEPTRFQGLIPGRTSGQKVKQALGEPAKVGSDGNAVVWSYQVGPFPRVDVTVEDDVVQSIDVQVENLPVPATVAEQLQVDGFRSAWIFDGKGQRLGIAFPERGVMLGLRQRNDGPRLGVNNIVLEPVGAELFVLRARNDAPWRCTRRLKDLDLALKLSPRHAEACGIKARILADLGRQREALKLAEEAIEGDPEAVEWQLLSIRLQAALGDPRAAYKQTMEVLERTELPAVLKAEAEVQAGDLSFSLGNHKAALQHHQRAIELAADFRDSEMTEVRKASLRVLASAHLGVANDIAWGQWRRKPDAVPQWIKSGHHFADRLISHEQDDELLAQRVQRLTLSAYDGFAHWIDPTRVCQAALKQGQELIEAAEDPLHRQRAEWELAETMYYAMRIQRQRGAFDEAVEFAKVASPIFAEARKRRELTPREQFLIGQLHFLAGSCLAVEADDHAGAAKWYDAGAMLLMEPFPPGVVDDFTLLGDQLVSMGVTYWRIDQRQRGLEFTRRGVQRLQEGARVGRTAPNTLRVAYGNLAAMLRAAGRRGEAAQWDSRIARLPNGKIR